METGEAAQPLNQDSARRYSRAKLRLSLSATAIELVLLAALAFTGASLGIEHAVVRRLPAQASAWLIVLGYVAALGALLKLASLPFSLAEQHIEIRYGLNRQSWASWWRDEAKGLALEAILGLAAIELIYALLRSAPRTWWLWGWLAFLAFTILLAQLAPVLLFPLFFKFRELSPENPNEAELIRRLSSRAAAAGARIRGIYEWMLGEKTVKANAALAGWGATRRVLISDTLMQTAGVDEIEAVFTHELGHHVHRHIRQGLLLQAGLSLAGFWLSARVLERLTPVLHLHGIADIAGLPLLALVVAALSLLLLPAANAFSRRLERQADDYVFSSTGRVEPLIQGLERLAQRNLAEVSPPRWKEAIFYSHPAIATRIRRAREWEKQRAATAP